MDRRVMRMMRKTSRVGPPPKCGAWLSGSQVGEARDLGFGRNPTRQYMPERGCREVAPLSGSPSHFQCMPDLGEPHRIMVVRYAVHPFTLFNPFVFGNIRASSDDARSNA